MSVPEAGQRDTFAAKRLLAPGPAVGPGPQGGSLQRAVRLDPAQQLQEYNNRIVT